MAQLRRAVPLADVLTPNIPEAEEITGMHIETEDDMCAAAKLIYRCHFPLQKK